MKLPYIKLYTADILAAHHHVSNEQLGRAIVAACESAFSNTFTYTAQNHYEENLFEMLCLWTEESRRAYKQHKKAGRKGGKRTQANRALKKQQIVGSEATAAALSTPSKHTETKTKTEPNTETETDTETETKNIYLLRRQ